MSQILRIACAADLGVAAVSRTSAPLPCSAAICESTVGSVVSQDCAATIKKIILS